jgi:mannose-1-phosphate guanylyltransferase
MSAHVPAIDITRVKAILLAAGVGARLQPLTSTLPKCLVPIGERPLLDYWRERLADAGILDALINTHAHTVRVRSYLEQANRLGPVKFTEFHEPRLLGSAGTIAANAGYADGAHAIVIIYADNYSDVDLRWLLSFHRSYGDQLTMLLFRSSNASDCGIVTLDEACRVVSYAEKPSAPVSDLANAGIYVCSPSSYREIALMAATDLGYDVLSRFVGRMRGCLWSGCHIDIGTLDGLNRARRHFTASLVGKAERARRGSAFS